MKTSINERSIMDSVNHIREHLRMFGVGQSEFSYALVSLCDWIDQHQLVEKEWRTAYECAESYQKMYDEVKKSEQFHSKKVKMLRKVIENEVCYFCQKKARRYLREACTKDKT